MNDRCWCGGTASPAPTAPGGFICLDSRFHEPFADGRPKAIDIVYIAGPMTGYPGNNYDAFFAAADLLRHAGYRVVNPAEFGSNGGHYVDLLREDLRAMLDAHAVATLENWWESTGARNEVQVAGILKMPVRPVQEWVAKKGVLL